MKKAIVFDLDGTLAESKQQLDTEIATLLASLIDAGYIFSVMSGGSLEQFKQQFLGSLSFLPDQYKKLFLLPTSGAALYDYQDDNWHEIYKMEISAEERGMIIGELKAIIQKLGLLPAHSYGELIEDRGTQITYSGLGQQAPITEKETWDPDQKKRKEIVALFSEKLPQFAAGIGGMTSIDITRKGVDKAYGIKKLSEFLAIPISKMVFVGDALFSGGNDFPARASGIDCIPVANVSETKEYIKSLLQ